MALITCPDCGKRISDIAPACPNCGRPKGVPPPSQENFDNERQPEFMRDVLRDQIEITQQEPPEIMMACPSCGLQIESGSARKCSRCGEFLFEADRQKAIKRKRESAWSWAILILVLSPIFIVIGALVLPFLKSGFSPEEEAKRAKYEQELDVLRGKDEEGQRQFLAQREAAKDHLDQIKPIIQEVGPFVRHNAPNQDAIKDTDEYKAACLNKWGTSIPTDDPTIKEFKKLLDSLEKKVQEPMEGSKRNHLVAVTFVVVDNLNRKYDIKISMLNFMRKMDERLPSYELAPYDLQACIYAASICLDEGKTIYPPR